MINYLSNNLRAKQAILSFKAMLILSVLHLVSSLICYLYFSSGSSSDSTVFDLINLGIGLLDFAGFVWCAATFISWLRRAYENIDRVGKLSTESKGNMAFWGFVIPFISLYKPYSMVKETYIKTQQTSQSFDQNYQVKEAPGIILIWWLLFLGSGVFAQIVFSSSWNNEITTMEDYLAARQMDMISALISMIAVICTFQMIHKVHTKEKELAEIIEAQPMHQEEEQIL